MTSLAVANHSKYSFIFEKHSSKVIWVLINNSNLLPFNFLLKITNKKQNYKK